MLALEKLMRYRLSISDQQRNTTRCAAFIVLAMYMRSAVNARPIDLGNLFFSFRPFILSTSDQARLPA